MKGNKQEQLEKLKNKLVKKEISHEEMNQLLELMSEENDEKFEKWQRLGIKANALKLMSLFFALRGKRYAGMRQFYKNLKIKITEGSDNCLEVFGGIYMTYNYLQPENFKILLEQIKEIENYEQEYYEYLLSGKERIDNKPIDYAREVAPEIIEKMEKRSQKIKQLSTEYVNN